MDSADPALPRVTAVVLNWHGGNDTRECVRALAALAFPGLSLLLIENGCNEFTAAEMTSLFPGARYVRTPVNLGFAGGANLGMRHALADGADYVWFVNQDAAPEHTALSELLAVARSSADVGIVGPKIVQQQHPERLDSIACRVDLRSGRLYLTGHDEIDHGQYDQLSEVDAVTGCAMLVSRAVCERLGGFDERYFAYIEDVDLCLRARSAGFRVRVAPRARVLHKRAPATQARQSVSSLYYATRNHLMMVQRHTHAPRLPRLTFVAALNAAYAVRSGGSDRTARLKAVWCGIRDFARGVTGPQP